MGGGSYWRGLGAKWGGKRWWRRILLARHEAKADSVGDGFEEDVFSRGEIDWSNEESENG